MEHVAMQIARATQDRRDLGAANGTREQCERDRSPPLTHLLDVYYCYLSYNIVTPHPCACCGRSPPAPR